MGIRWEVDWNTLRTQKFKTSPTPLPPNKKNFGPLGCMFLHHFMHPRGCPANYVFLKNRGFVTKYCFFKRFFPKWLKFATNKGSLDRPTHM